MRFSTHSKIKQRTTIQFPIMGLCVLLVGVFFFTPLRTHAENIESFTSYITLNKDGTYTIVEDILYLFTGEKHGMSRCIPTTHQDQASSIFKERYIDIDITSVKADSGDVPYILEKSRKKICVKIGDPNKTVTGEHEYRIEYTVSGATSYQKYGGADLYWNVTGNEWDVSIRSINAYIKSPDSLFMRERSCYQGRLGEEDSCRIETLEDGTIRFSGSFLNSHEGLTLAQSINRSNIPYDVRERFSPFIVWPIGILFSILVGAFAIFRFKTKFKTDQVIIPQYEPYDGLKPMYTGVLFDNSLDSRDISAGIVYLAEQGFLKIRKLKEKVLFFFEVDNFEITLKREPDESITEFDQELLRMFFADSDLRVGTSVTLNSLKRDVSKQKENMEILRKLKKAVEKNLEDEGFFQRIDVYSRLKGPIGYTIFIMFVAFLIPNPMSRLVGVILLIAVFVMLFLQRRRTAKGYEALDQLKGFKDFLQVTESQRYIFHNAPEKNAEQFMEFLPYAIAFGVEKEWAKTFEGVSIPNPDWYDGGGVSNSFSAGALTSSIGEFSTFMTSSVTHSSSASSGGGSSGGGSGGGGGGSW